MSTITKELAKLFRKITNSEIDAEGNAHVVLSPADSLLINNARIELASLEAGAVAQRIQEEEVRKLELWRIENPPGVDHLGRVKRRRSIKGPSLMKCIRQVMNLSGGY